MIFIDISMKLNLLKNFRCAFSKENKTNDVILQEMSCDVMHMHDNRI